MVILSAGLKGIRTELLEAARVDGANEGQVFRRIILPLLAPTIAVVATTMIIYALKTFDVVYTMTNGNFDTDVIANLMYQELFNNGQLGRASGDRGHPAGGDRAGHVDQPAAVPRAGGDPMTAPVPAPPRTGDAAPGRPGRGPAPVASCTYRCRAHGIWASRRSRCWSPPSTGGGGQPSGWWTAITPPCQFTLENYEYVLAEPASTRLPQQPDHHDPGDGPRRSWSRRSRLRLRVDGVPGSQHPVRVVVGLLVVPLQITLIPVLRLFAITCRVRAARSSRSGWPNRVWPAVRDLPAAQLLRVLPREVFESAAIDGASPDVVLPSGAPDERPGARLAGHLPVPVGLERPAGGPGCPRACPPEPSALGRHRQPATSFGGGWQFLAAAAFISMIIPILVFLSLQRYFVRGITGGAVKG